MQHWKWSLLISLEQLVALTTMGFVWIILTITISVTEERIVETPAGVTWYLTRLTLYRRETKLLCQRNCWIRMKNLLGKNDINYQTDGDGRYRNWCDTFDRLKFTKLLKVKFIFTLDFLGFVCLFISNANRGVVHIGQRGTVQVLRPRVCKYLPENEAVLLVFFKQNRVLKFNQV